MIDFITDDIGKEMNRSLYTKYFDKASKMLHFTYDRISGNGPGKEWRTFEILKELLKITKIFIEHLPEKYKSERINILNNFINQQLGSVNS